MFYKISVFKIFESFYRKKPVLDSLFNKLYYKQAPKQVFSSEMFYFLTPFYRTSPVAASVFCKDFVDITYENSHAHTRRLNVAAAYLLVKFLHFALWNVFFV